MGELNKLHYCSFCKRTGVITEEKYFKCYKCGRDMIPMNEVNMDKFWRLCHTHTLFAFEEFKEKLLNLYLYDNNSDKTYMVNKYMQELESKPRDYIPKAKKQELIRKMNAKPTVTCPYCKSTNCKKLDFIDKSLSIGFFGLLSNKIGKQWHCKNCKSDF